MLFRARRGDLALLRGGAQCDITKTQVVTALDGPWIAASEDRRLLDRVKTPEDLRKLPESDLPQLAAELRQETIDAVSVTGGHLGAGLGVVELTVALHWVFDTPRDRLVWDVGHQTYPHKILTGPPRPHPHPAPAGRAVGLHAARRERVRRRSAPRIPRPRSPPGSAWRSRAISRRRDNNVVCVIGDGAMTAGMAYEAMNNAGARDERLIVV